MSTGTTRDGAAANIARQTRFWGQRAASWDHHAAHNPGLLKVIDALIELAAPTPKTRAADIGCGSGQLTLRLAPLVGDVLAIDISEKMIDLLEQNAKTAGIDNVKAVASPIERLEVEAGSLDLVVSNYVLHHLRDADKAVVVEKMAGWLKPGGLLVIGDMMFGRGGDRRDRTILAEKLLLFIRRGPAGWWRIAKNLVRFLLRVSERPVSMQAWAQMFERAGLVEVSQVPVVNEAAIVSGRRPQR